MLLSELAILSCGRYGRHNAIGEVLKNIGANITTVEKRILELPNETDQYVSLHGPFYGRALLESVCTAIIGRIDPFRLLVVKQVQQYKNFGLGSRSKSAINWQGDIFQEGLKDTSPHKMWKSDLKYDDMGRGLLGDYYGKIYWESAYQELLDVTADLPGEDILENYRATTTPENFTSRIRQNCSKLYSSLSKGVHSELVIKSDIIYDRITVLDLMSDTMKLCGILGLVSHMMDSCLCQLYFHQATGLYKVVKERSDTYGNV